ncbi:MAG: hypothetical protein WC205_13830 [Opitutaceae bacterium]|jgi:hypothetical protein
MMETILNAVASMFDQVDRVMMPPCTVACANAISAGHACSTLGARRVIWWDSAELRSRKGVFGKEISPSLALYE